MSTHKDNFKDKASTWDKNNKRVLGAKKISDLIVKNINLQKGMNIMDFGAGTGLLSFCISDYVHKITAVDNSSAMLKEFAMKQSLFKCDTELLELDITTNDHNKTYNGIISSMTIHHIEDIASLFSKFYNMLDEHGFIAIADLDCEDGTFHSENTGVFHFGFAREELIDIAKSVGFSNVHIETANTINKPHKTFSVFLLTATV